MTAASMWRKRLDGAGTLGGNIPFRGSFLAISRRRPRFGWRRGGRNVPRASRTSVVRSAAVRKLARALVLAATCLVLASVERASAQSGPTPTFCAPTQLSVTGNCCPAGQVPQTDGSCAAPPAPAVQCPAGQVSAGSFCTSCLPNQVVSNNACVTPAASQCGGAPTVTVNGYVMCCPAGDSASSTKCANNPYTTDNPAGCATSQITTSGTCCPAGESPTAGGACCPSGQLTGANTCCPSGTAPQSDNTCKPTAATTTPSTCPAGATAQAGGGCAWPVACPVAQLSNTGTCCPTGQAPTINGTCVVPPTSCPKNEVLSNNACICPFPQLMQADGSCFAGCPAGTNQVVTNGMYSCVAPPGCPEGQHARTNPGGGFTCLCDNGGGLPVNGSCASPVPPPTCGVGQTAQPNAGGTGFTCVCADPGYMLGPNGVCAPPPPTCLPGQIAKQNPGGNGYTCVCVNSGQPPGPNGTCAPPPPPPPCSGDKIPRDGKCVCPPGFLTMPRGECLLILAACEAGTVRREAFAGDVVCVTPAVREQVLIDNRSQAGRTRPGGGCVAGYVWREANAADHVCVPPSTRTQTITDNERWQRGQIAPQKPTETRTNPPPSCRDGHCATKRSTPSRQKRYIFRRGRSTASPTNRKR
jgi:hypothetical protein